MAKPFGTILTALVTPMKPNGDIDYDAAAALAKRLVADGSDGLVVNGTTGEAPTTHAPEKAELVRVIVEAVPDAVVVAGAGSNDTDHAKRMARQAEKAGADGLLVVAPYYSRPTQEGVIQHITRVADSTSLPTMVYDVPGRTGVRLAPETYTRLAADEQVVAVKDATGRIYQAAKSHRETGLAWYSGDDSLFLAFLAAGAVGIVSVVAHVAAGRLADVAREFEAGHHARALEIFDSVTPAIDALNGDGFQAVMAKAALELTGRIPSRHLRLPYVDADESQIAQVRQGLLQAGLI